MKMKQPKRLSRHPRNKLGVAHDVLRKEEADSLIGKLTETLSEGFARLSLGYPTEAQKSDFRLLQLSGKRPGPDEIDKFAVDYQIRVLDSKYPYGLDGTRAETAIATFVEAEALCRETNHRLGRFHDCSRSVEARVISTARHKIHSILGPEPDLDEMSRAMGFSGGASTSLRRRDANRFKKFGHKPDVSSNCALLGWCAVRSVPRWWEFLTGNLPETVSHDMVSSPPNVIFNIVPGNRICTVPKSTKTDRTIAIEPDLNMFVQKGFAKMIRRRLRMVGIDLDTQASVNQMLAWKGSADGSYCTIDLSSASDTVSLAIVDELLPPGWIEALKQCRSPLGTLPSGQVVRYHKFSSMGNAYTFELESLIFWALAKATMTVMGVKGVVSVFGDDIIVPEQAGPTLMEILRHAGFVPNADKSFLDGPFRESCGKHYYLGVDVTPIYLRKPPIRLIDLYAVANAIRRKARRVGYLEAWLKPAYEMVVDAIPAKFRYLIPEGVGDVGLVADFDEACPPMNRDIQAFRYRYVSEVQGEIMIWGYPRLIGLLSILETRDLGEDPGRTPSLPTGKYRVRVGSTTVWPSYGPWK